MAPEMATTPLIKVFLQIEKRQFSAQWMFGRARIHSASLGAKALSGPHLLTV